LIFKQSMNYFEEIVGDHARLQESFTFQVVHSNSPACQLIKR
jgi:hypothetical protein